jgi:magnesium chelatase family protein
MNEEQEFDWKTIPGYSETKRKMEIAAAGLHSILLVGPKDPAKSLLARSLRTILPGNPIVITPCPITDSLASAVEQASGGVLLLEDIEQWSEPSLALLRETCRHDPGRFHLVATTSYCPCGNYEDERRDCSCFTVEVEAYQKRLYQTIDACFAIEAQIPAWNRSLAARGGNEPSRIVRERVEAARLIQVQRNGAARPNCALSRPEVEEYSSLEMQAQQLLAAAKEQLHLSADQELFLLQVARTAADLACGYTTVPCVQMNHIAESICCRPRWTKR